MRKQAILPILFLLLFALSFVQAQPFTRQDSIRGSITPERAWWNLTYYHLQIKVDITNKSFKGQNAIYYTVLEAGERMQVDLQPPLKITKVMQGKKELAFTQDGNAYYVSFNTPQKVGDKNSIVVFYEGIPQVSIRPPWSGGVTWNKDDNGNDFIATSCQGDGASLWWPCKDHMYDEPDSMLISITVPKHLINVSNGRLRSVVKHKDKTRTFNWFVSNPINNYGVNINIGDYVHFSETYQGENGVLDCDYYVLKYNLEKAKVQFKDATRTLEAFEYWFGPYPFYEDGYKLVEAPYLGMEHQSSITYGNGYANGYLGRDLSQTGWGLKWDFIIVHESGHEWFANNITYKDIADMWIHESFTAYSENLFLDYHFGKQASAEYVIGTRQNIQNDKPIIGPYDVNKSGSSDMYYKGANMLHTLRQLVEDDTLWREILRGLNKEFYHQTVTTMQIENYISRQAGKDLSAFFNQYLRDTRIPVLEYVIKESRLQYRWSQVVQNFDMPVIIYINGKKEWIFPTAQWSGKEIKEGITEVKVDVNFYVAVFNLEG
ncbi:Peptidase M1 family protein [hydrothermal vent metagenome]|uniref:Peptidase M1 family protein n=1 Tax=hydrothermal vent metagenome TaxID=652676 RepID=A0A3B0UD37_9ZZZZ